MDLILSSTSAASSAEVMLCVVDAASFFVSPLVLCIGRILSLRNLIDHYPIWNEVIVVVIFHHILLLYNKVYNSTH